MYQDIDVNSYRQQYDGTDHALIDVRTPGEFIAGHLPGAVNIPLRQLQQRIDEIPAGVPVIVVCATGNRSITGAKIIARAGYTDVSNLLGGTMAWMMQGLPVENTTH